MEKLTFTINQPVTLALESIEGTPVESNFGGMQHRFASDAGTFWVSEAAGFAISDQLQKLGVQPGDTVEICKAEKEVGRGRKSILWIVTLPVGEQQNGTMALPKAPKRAIAAAPAKPAAVAPADAPGDLEAPLWASVLLAQATVMTDVFHRALQHASERYGNAVKPETIQAFVITSFINLAKKQEGNNRAAA